MMGALEGRGVKHAIGMPPDENLERDVAGLLRAVGQARRYRRRWVANIVAAAKRTKNDEGGWSNVSANA